MLWLVNEPKLSPCGLAPSLSPFGLTSHKMTNVLCGSKSEFNRAYFCQIILKFTKHELFTLQNSCARNTSYYYIAQALGWRLIYKLPHLLLS
jgi:hypothetical protein